MARYSFNRTILHELPPGSHPYALITKKGDRYYLMFESDPFVYDGSILVKRESDWLVYYCYSDSSKWIEGSFTASDGESEYVRIDITASYVWTNVNIVDVDSGEVVYPGSIPEYYSPDIPVATLYCNGRTNAVIPIEEPGWHIQARLKLSVSELESGATREIKWYANGSEFQNGGFNVKPLCDSAGTYSYFVTVTDTGFNGMSVTCTSNTVTVVAEDMDLGDWSGDGYTEDNVPWVDIITPYPENDPNAEAEVPTILSCGANAMYDKGETASLLSCVAMVSDGGELSYEWYEDGNPAYSTDEITPSTEDYGKKTYFCVVTNTLNGSTASAVSDVITITVWSHKRFKSGIVVGLSCDGWYMGETANDDSMNDPFLQGVEIGRKLKSQKIGQKKTPVACMYNGLMLPVLHERDEEAYPYVIYTIDGAIASSTPFIAKQGFGVTAIPSVPHLSCDLIWDENGERLSGWEKVDESGYTLMYKHWYTNHDILNADGSVYCAAHDEPVPVYLPVIMFEGELTTKVIDDGYDSTTDYPEKSFTSLCGWTVGDTIRVTINGITEEHTVRVSERAPKASYGGIIGNEGLWEGVTEDDGGDWFIQASQRSGTSSNYGQALFTFYTREPGVYQVKVEKTVIAKE